MTSNLSISPIGQRSQAFHSTLRSRSRQSFEEAITPLINHINQAIKIDNYQNQWRANESSNSLGNNNPKYPLWLTDKLFMKRTPNFVAYASDPELKGLKIMNLPTLEIAQQLKKVIEDGLNIYFRPIIEVGAQEDSKSSLCLRSSSTYDFWPFLRSFKARIEFLVDEYFLKTPFSAESEVN